jgi:hypothetical protein
MKNLLTAVLGFLAATTALAQSATQDFIIALPTEKATASLYKTVKLVDGRTNPQNLGIVQLGAFNRKARVVAETPLSEQLSRVMDALTSGATTGSGELFFLLRQLSFAEVTGAMSERGYCHFRAALFARKGEGFQKLDAVDTVFLVKGMDVTKGLLRQGSKAITGFLSANLSKEPTDTVTYSSNDVVNLDALEKGSLPLYNTDVYKEGLYKTFAAFSQQAPDETAFAVDLSKEGKPSAVKTMNEKGKMVKVNKKDLYAFVFKGQPYIVTEYGFYPLAKKGGDFHFTGKAKVTANSGDVLMASLFFGVIGGLIASSPGAALFEMKIDHLSGGFVRIKEVTAPGNDDNPVN